MTARVPEPDWEKVSRALEKFDGLPDKDEWGASKMINLQSLRSFPPIEAARWALTAHERGERVVVYESQLSQHLVERTIERAFDGPPTHLLVPLEGDR